MGVQTGAASNQPVSPIPFTTVALNMNGIAPWYNACLQCGHMYGHAVKSSLPGTKLARGS